MRFSLLATVLVASVITAPASEIRFYFSHQSDLGGVPNEYTTQTNPVAVSGDTVYLWAKTINPDIWTGVSIQIGAQPPGWDIAAGIMYNPSSESFGQRWEDASDFYPVSDHLFTLVSVTQQGLGAVGDPLSVDAIEEGHLVHHLLVGELAFSTDTGYAEVRLGASDGGIPRKGGTTQEEVYFGFGDPPTLPGGENLLPDLYIVPEPATFGLFLTWLAFARRR